MKIAELEGQDKAVYQDTVFLKTFNKSVTKTGKTYGQGILSTLDKKDYAYKIWESDLIEVLEGAIKQSGGSHVLIFEAGGTTNVYNGSFGVFVKSLSNTTHTYSPYDFAKSDYDVRDLMEKLTGAYKTKVSEKGLKVIGHILTGNIAKQFVQSVAAISHHDNQVHGLLAHTTKMEQIASVVLENYPSLFATQDMKDLFLIGILFHDIGKTKEYNLFDEDKFGFLGHRYLGAKMIEEYEGLIVGAYGEMGYAHLLSILLQHHGIYEERPKTVLAYAVHLVDALEANLTGLNEALTVANEQDLDYVRVPATDNSRFNLNILKDND